MKNKILLTSLLLAFPFQVMLAQAPKYTPKHFVSANNPKEFEEILPAKDGFTRKYISTPITVYDVDDLNTSHIKLDFTALICIEGDRKNGNLHGILTTYVLDSADHHKRYKIWEQAYANGKLNGEWLFYNLAGTLVSRQSFRADSLHGKSTFYWIDGKRIISEDEYFNDESKVIMRKYGNNGLLSSEYIYIHQILNGLAKRYYPNGVLQEEAETSNAEFHGINRYYYPSGKIWLEKENKHNKPWTMIANYTEEGKKRNPGTLKDGNGTIIFYNENGTVRETVIYINGIARK